MAAWAVLNVVKILHSRKIRYKKVIFFLLKILTLERFDIRWSKTNIGFIELGKESACKTNTYFPL